MKWLTLTLFVTLSGVARAGTPAFPDRSITCIPKDGLLNSEFHAGIESYPILTDVKVWSYTAGQAFVLREGVNEELSEEAQAANADTSDNNVLASDPQRLNFLDALVSDEYYYLSLPRDLKELSQHAGTFFEVPLKGRWIDRDGLLADKFYDYTAECHLSEYP